MGEYVFPSSDGRGPGDIKSAWERAVKEAGLTDVCFHYHTYEAHRKGKCGLLIPLLKDPPLAGTNRYYLANGCMAEFIKQSMELYNQGCIQILRAKWEELIFKNAIPLSMAAQVLDR